MVLWASLFYLCSLTKITFNLHRNITIRPGNWKGKSLILHLLFLLHYLLCYIIIRHCGGIKRHTITVHVDCFHFVYFFHLTFLCNSAFSLHASTPFILHSSFYFFVFILLFSFSFFSSLFLPLLTLFTFNPFFLLQISPFIQYCRRFCCILH